MKKKTPHTNTPEKQSQKNRCWQDEYFNIYLFKKLPVSEGYIMILAQELRDWAARDTNLEFEADYTKREALRMTDFLDMKGIPLSTWQRWVAKYDFLKQAEQFALRRIGARREYGALKDKYKEKTIHLTLGHYDPVFREEQERLAKLAKQNIEELIVYRTKEVEVEVPDFGSSSLVKEKKQENE